LRKSSYGECRIGVIGCGQIVQSVHLKILPRLLGVEIVAIAEPNAERRTATQQSVLSAIAFEHYTDLLVLPEVDAVVICLPNFLHAEVAIAAMKHGKHVHLEKPFAIDTMQGQRLLNVWQQTGVIGIVEFNYRYNRVLPTLAFDLALDGLGQMMGYGVGMGNSMENKQAIATP
jgi:UDP-N-acetylglucosamine 3-dehydrogenase